MSVERARKAERIEKLTEQFGSSIATLCADSRGLSVAEMVELRADLKRSGAFGEVVKNTLAKISAKQAFEKADEDVAGAEEFLELFRGPSFTVFASEDPAGPAKALVNFAKNHKELEIKGGIFEGNFIGVDEVKRLSEMPSKEELYSKLLSVLNAPGTKVVQLLSAPGTQLVRTLEAYRAKLEAEGGGAE